MELSTPHVQCRMHYVICGVVQDLARKFYTGLYLEHIWFRRTLHGYCNVFITVIVIEMEMSDVIVLSKARIRCFYSMCCRSLVFGTVINDPAL